MPTKRNLKHIIIRKVCKKRSNNAEHPFGTIKYLMRQVPLLLIGIEKVHRLKRPVYQYQLLQSETVDKL